MKHLNLLKSACFLFFFTLFTLNEAVANEILSGLIIHSLEVNDTISCPGDIIVNSTPGSCGAIVTFPDPNVIEPFDVIMVSGLSSGSLFPIATTTQTFGATDASGNIVSTCSFDVTVLPLTDDSDCDGVTDDCDVCDGADDNIDANNDGLPDCANFPGFEFVDESWECSNNPNNKKYYICHRTNGGHNNTICVAEQSVMAHLAHGDFLGPCIECGNQSRVAANSKTEYYDADVKVFPNPITDIINLSMDGFADGDIYIRILNMTGQIVWDEMINGHAGKIDRMINIQDQLKSGYYFIQVAQNDFVVSKSFVVMDR